jgi:hypothetical protein
MILRLKRSPFHRWTPEYLERISKNGELPRSPKIPAMSILFVLYLMFPLASFTTIGTVTLVLHSKPQTMDPICRLYGRRRLRLAGFYDGGLTYHCDSYKPQPSEISVIINRTSHVNSLPPSLYSFGSRQETYNALVFAFNIGFYRLPFAQ